MVNILRRNFKTVAAGAQATNKFLTKPTRPLAAPVEPVSGPSTTPAPSVPPVIQSRVESGRGDRPSRPDAAPTNQNTGVPTGPSAFVNLTSFNTNSETQVVGMIGGAFGPVGSVGGRTVGAALESNRAERDLEESIGLDTDISGTSAFFSFNPARNIAQQRLGAIQGAARQGLLDMSSVLSARTKTERQAVANLTNSGVSQASITERSDVMKQRQQVAQDRATASTTQTQRDLADRNARSGLDRSPRGGPPGADVGRGRNSRGL